MKFLYINIVILLLICSSLALFRRRALHKLQGDPKILKFIAKDGLAREDNETTITWDESKSEFTFNGVAASNIEKKQPMKAFFGLNSREFAVLSERMILQVSSSLGDPNKLFFLEIEPDYQGDIIHQPFDMAARDLIDAYGSFLVRLIEERPMEVAPGIDTFEKLKAAFEPGINKLRYDMVDGSGILQSRMMLLREELKENHNRSSILIEMMHNALKDSIDNYNTAYEIMQTIDYDACPNYGGEGMPTFNDTFLRENILNPAKAAAGKERDFSIQSLPFTSTASAPPNLLPPPISQQFPISKRSQGWLKKASDAAAGALVKKLGGLIDDEIKKENERLGTADTPVLSAMFRVETQMAKAKRLLGSDLKPLLSDTLFQIFTETPYLTAVLSKADAKIQKIEKSLLEWMKELEQYFTRLFKKDTEAEAKFKQEATKKSKLEPGQPEVFSSIFTAVVKKRFKSCFKQFVEKTEKRATEWTTDNKFKPDIKFAKFSIEKLILNDVITFTKNELKHQVHINLEVKDPFGKSKSSLNAHVSWDAKGEAWKAGLTCDAQVAGIFSKSPTMKQVHLTAFAGYNKNGFKTGIFVSATIPFEKDNNKVVVLPVIMQYKHETSWMPNKNFQIGFKAKVKTTGSHLDTIGVGLNTKFMLNNWIITGSAGADMINNDPNYASPYWTSNTQIMLSRIFTVRNTQIETGIRLQHLLRAPTVETGRRSEFVAGATVKVTFP